jgi:hypothetical protein
VAGVLTGLAFVFALVSVAAARTIGPIAPESILLYIATVQVLVATLFREKDLSWLLGLLSLIVAVVGFWVSYPPAFLPESLGDLLPGAKSVGIPVSQIAAAVASLLVTLRERTPSPVGAAASNTPATSNTAHS